MTMKDEGPMRNRAEIIDCLKKTPAILTELVAEASPALLKKRGVAGKWSIHEHPCHLVDVHPMLIGRFIMFRNEEAPWLII
jgi:hypothetical protein